MVLSLPRDALTARVDLAQAPRTSLETKQDLAKS